MPQRPMGMLKIQLLLYKADRKASVYLGGVSEAD
jgi:hypothetical protein